jgi:hypothetical protein
MLIGGLAAMTGSRPGVVVLGQGPGDGQRAGTALASVAPPPATRRPG